MTAAPTWQRVRSWAGEYAPFWLPVVGIAVAIAAVLTLLWGLPGPLALPRATVHCYSAGRRIYEGRAPAGLGVERTWSGVRFRDEQGRRIRIRGDCVVIYDAD